MVSVKYVTIVLRADDEGEGGTFAVYSLLSRYVCALVIFVVGEVVRKGGEGRCEEQC